MYLLKITSTKCIDSALQTSVVNSLCQIVKININNISLNFNDCISMSGKVIF